MDQDEWKAMIKRMDSGLPPAAQAEVDPATGIVLASGGEAAADGEGLTPGVKRSGTVAVRNGTGIEGLASEAKERVEELGYSTTLGNADSYKYEETEIIYKNLSQKKYAEELRDALGGGKLVHDTGDYLFTADLLVIVGADFS